MERSRRYYKIIPADEYSAWIAQIPVRYLRTDDHAPSGRPLAHAELGRALTARERYVKMKLRRKGHPEHAITKAITSGDIG
jgi:hypothetical protein